MTTATTHSSARRRCLTVWGTTLRCHAHLLVLLFIVVLGLLTTNRSHAAPTPALQAILAAGGTASYAYTCALTPAGVADCWGEIDGFPVGDQPGPYTQLSSGRGHTCALTPHGAVECWGDDAEG